MDAHLAVLLTSNQTVDQRMTVLEIEIGDTMPFSFMSQADHSWEPLESETPIILLDQHPDGVFAAMQVSQGGTNRAAVWDVHTKKIVCNPGNLNALCWMPGGTEILAVREEYLPQPHLHNVGGIQIMSPLQQEYSHFVERYSWPRMDRIASTPITLPTGWISHIVASPCSEIAFVVWNEQDAGGVELISWQGGNLRQITGKGFSTSGILAQGPIISSDGRTLAMSYAEPFWWFDPEDEDMDPYDDEGAPSPGGEFEFGSLVIGDVQNASYAEFPLTIVIPEGWTPDDPDEASYQAVTSLAYASDGSMQVSLWNGEVRTMQIPRRGA